MDTDALQLMVQLSKSGNLPLLTQLLGSGEGPQVALRNKALTSTLLYGNGGLFSTCADDNLINASVNDDGLAAIIPWQPTTSQVRRQPAITALGDLEGEDQPRDQCADPPGTNWRGCEIEWCLGRIRHKSPEFDRTDNGLSWCDRVPRFRVFGSVNVGGDVIFPNGSRIQNDAEWGAVTAAVGVRQTLCRWMYIGNPVTNGHMFSGLQLLVNTGYVDLATRIACPAIDSKVENFAFDCIGDPTATRNIYAYFDAVVTRIIYRASYAQLGRPLPTDLRIVVRPEVAQALYEYWACNLGPCATGFGSSLIAGASTPTQIQIVNADWARQQADDLRQRGVLRVHGMDIPVVEDAYMPFTTLSNGRRISDAYILTMQVSGMPLIYGEYQDFREGIPTGVDGNPQELYGGRPTDDGRFYVWQERRNTCFDVRVAIKPRLIVALPFLQGRISNICVQPLNPPLSAYPPDGSPYYPDGGAYQAWYDVGECVYPNESDSTGIGGGDQGGEAIS